MNNQNKILIGIAITYLVVVSLVALQITRTTCTTSEDEKAESKDEKAESTEMQFKEEKVE
jgi:hypothetical protein